jgi:hypothetical protein
MKLAVLFTTGLLAYGSLVTGDDMSAQVDAVAERPGVLILDSAPLAPDAVLATRPILSEQTLLSPGSDPFAVREGEVVVGTPLVYPLEIPKSAAPLPIAGAARSVFYLVVFRFTLEPPVGKRRYRAMTFKVELSDPKTTAYQLIPERVTSEEDVKEGIDIGFVISLPGYKAGSPAAAELRGEATRSIGFTRLIPEITAFGIGTGFFRWQFAGHADMPLAPGMRTAAAVLQIPEDMKRLNAHIGWDIDLERGRFEGWFDVPTKVEGVKLDLPLL